FNFYNVATAEIFQVNCEICMCLTDSSSNKENTYIQCGKAEASPLVGESLWELQNAARKALSPVQSTVQPRKCSGNLVPIILLEPRTPKTPYEGAGTPLQKFNTLSCKLKDSLVQEYLEFLNTASKYGWA
ncbi:hypothetical protein Taro_052602, partial [Colocasia esculenta]|nr:hypothetical protein [Colocasia esculenta]